MFGHVNGKDWTLRGFLTSERGPLKLSIADDNATRAALSHAALRFCTRPVEELRGHDGILLGAIPAMWLIPALHGKIEPLMGMRPRVPGEPIPGQARISGTFVGQIVSTSFRYVTYGRLVFPRR